MENSELPSSLKQANISPVLRIGFRVCEERFLRNSYVLKYLHPQNNIFLWF